MTDLTIEKRGPGRPSNAELAARSQRAPQLSKSESLARAEARLREIRSSDSFDNGERDKYWAPDAPEGWDYQWKRRTIYGKEDPSYAVELIRQGWETVPLLRHPEMMPHGWKGEIIEVDGLVLMERPKEITDKARKREALDARTAVFTKEQQLRGVKMVESEFNSAKIKKGYEAIQIPDE